MQLFWLGKQVGLGDQSQDLIEFAKLNTLANPSLYGAHAPRGTF